MQTASVPVPSTLPTSPSPAIPRLSTLSTVLIVLCGIVMPAITNLVEALLHMCADGFFDPLPTVGHVFAIATVPLANAFSLWALRRATAPTSTRSSSRRRSRWRSRGSTP